MSHPLNEDLPSVHALCFLAVFSSSNRTSTQISPTHISPGEVVHVLKCKRESSSSTMFRWRDHPSWPHGGNGASPVVPSLSCAETSGAWNNRGDCNSMLYCTSDEHNSLCCPSITHIPRGNLVGRGNDYTQRRGRLSMMEWLHNLQGWNALDRRRIPHRPLFQSHVHNSNIYDLELICTKWNSPFCSYRSDFSLRNATGMPHFVHVRVWLLLVY